MICTNRLNGLASIVLFTLSCGAAPVLAQPAYVQHNLVSDVAGLADHTNANMVNGWGVTHSDTSAWWVNANGAGVSLVLDGGGLPFPAASPLVVTVPPPPGGQISTPTGIVFNGTAGFQMAAGKPAVFLFATEDGTISAWNPAIDPANAVREVNLSGSAVYRGLALGSINGMDLLLAADFHNARIDAYDAGFHLTILPAGAFTDSTIPAGFAPYNIQNVGGSIFVTYARQDSAMHDVVPGAGAGYVDQFSLSGVLLARMATGSWMNAPWGVAVVPPDFGFAANTLLVGNFGSGQIAIFNASGQFQDLLRGQDGNPITIDGLRGIMFGNGGNAGPANTLYFAAGIQKASHGLFGTLTLAPATGVSNPNNGEDNGDKDKGKGDGNGNGNGKGKGNGKGNGDENGNGNGKGGDDDN